MRLYGLAAAAAISCLVCSPSRAQQQGGDLIHWSYAAFFGTGWYELDGRERVFAMSYMPRPFKREASISQDGSSRRLGIEVQVALSISLHRFDLGTIGKALELDNLSTFSVVPGVEIEIPMTPRWSLKPVAHIGWGSELRGNSSASIYWAGVKSRLRFDGGKIDWALINSLFYAHYSPRSGSSGRMTPLVTGFEFRQPLPKKSLGGDPLNLIWHVAVRRYNDFDFAFESVAPKSAELEQEWELGAAFSKGDRPIRLWRLRWDQIGIAYRVSHEGSLTGIGITFRGLFDR